MSLQADQQSGCYRKGRHVRAGEPGQRVFTPVVDQHASWIAVNPVQGCPKRCEYCFLHERSQDEVAPVQLATPAEATEMLLASPFYGPERAVALFTWTDVMAVASSRAYLAGLLGSAGRPRGLPNPVVLITKCRIPGRHDRGDQGGAGVGAAGDRLPQLLRPGLGGRGGHPARAARGELPRAVGGGHPGRALLAARVPASATAETMTRVLDLAARYAACTMAAGLKVEAGALPRLSRRWPELAATPGVTEAECVYPAAFWEFIHRTGDLYPGYPVFHANSCALAYVAGRGGQVRRPRQPRLHAPQPLPRAQRGRCAAALGDRAPGDCRADRAAALASRGLDGSGLRPDSGDADRLAAARPSRTRWPPRSPRTSASAWCPAGRASDAYWSSGTSGAPPAGDRGSTMTGPATLARMLDHTRRLRAGFAATAPEPWDGTTAAAELAVQLGHLAQCIGRRHGVDLSGVRGPGPADHRHWRRTGRRRARRAQHRHPERRRAAGPPGRGSPPGAPATWPRTPRCCCVLVIAAGQARRVRDGRRRLPAPAIRRTCPRSPRRRGPPSPQPASSPPRRAWTSPRRST